jgi:hypothetical protein
MKSFKNEILSLVSWEFAHGFKNLLPVRNSLYALFRIPQGYFVIDEKSETG